MYILDNKEQLFNFIMDTYRLIKDRHPGVYDNIFTEEKARSIVNNDQLLKNFKKRIEAHQAPAKKDEAFGKLNANIPEALISTNRILAQGCDSSNTVEAELNNKRIKEIAENKDMIKQYSEEVFKDLLNTNIMKVKVEDIDDVIKFYNENARALDAGSVFSSVFAANANNFGYTEEKIKFYNDNVSLFESAGQIKDIIDYSYSVFNLFLDELKADDREGLMGEIGEELAKYDEMGFEEFKYGDNIYKQFANYHVSKIHIPNIIDGFKTKKELLGHRNVSFLDIIENVKFKDEEGNDITHSEAYSNINAKIEVKSTLNNYDTKVEISNNVNELTNTKSLFDRGMEEERLRISTELFHKFKEAYPEADLKLEEFTKNVNNEEFIVNHRKAIKINRDNFVKSEKQDELVPETDQGIARSARSKFMVDDTVEAIENNKNVAKQIGNVKGAKEYIIKEIKNLANLDVSKYAYDTDVEYLDNYNNDIKDIGQGFVVKSMLQNTGYSASGAVKNYVNKVTAIPESLSVYDTVVEHYSSPFNAICPVDLNKKGLNNINKNYKIFESVLGKNLNKYSDFRDYHRSTGSENMIQSLGLSYSSQATYEKSKEDMAQLKELIDNNVFTSSPQKDNYIIEKATGKHVSLKKYLDAYATKDQNELDKYEVKRYTDFEKETIDEVIDNSLSVNYLHKIANSKDDVLRYMNNILNAKAWRAKTNSTEYNDLCQAINAIKGDFENGCLSSVSNIDKMSYKEYSEKYELIKKVVQTANKYKIEKEKQPKNRTRQKRYDNSISLIDILKKPASLDTPEFGQDKTISEIAIETAHARGFDLPIELDNEALEADIDAKSNVAEYNTEEEIFVQEAAEDNLNEKSFMYRDDEEVELGGVDELEDSIDDFDDLGKNL